MKLTTDQLISWSFTVSAAAGLHRPEQEAEYRAMIASLKGKERSGISSGVKQGVNDLLQWVDDWPKEKHAAVEAALRAKGLPSLEEMQRLLSKKHLRILKQGVIKNDEEYYLVVEMLSDLTFGLSQEQRIALGSMVGVYENRVSKSKP
jgi:hypothetical protein